MDTDQITLLNLDCDQNVSSRPKSKKQVAQRHHWRGPERDDEAEHQWMPQEFVDKGRPEANLFMLRSTQVEIDLPQPEELKVVDKESGQQHECPPESKKSPQDSPSD